MLAPVRVSANRGVRTSAGDGEGQRGVEDVNVSADCSVIWGFLERAAWLAIVGPITDIFATGSDYQLAHQKTPLTRIPIDQ